MMMPRANWRAVCTAQACQHRPVAQMDVPVVGAADGRASWAWDMMRFLRLLPRRPPMLIAGMNELKEAIAFAKSIESKWAARA